MKNFLFSFFVLFLAVVSNAQNTSSNYQTAVGIRAGGTSGITVKHFIASNQAIEGIVGLWNNGFGATVLLEIHESAGEPGLNWYYGAGGHIAVWDNSGRNGRDAWFYNNRIDGIALGVDGIVGLEYKIQPIPIAISADLKPLLGIHSGGNIHFGLDPGIGVKFVF